MSNAIGDQFEFIHVSLDEISRLREVEALFLRRVDLAKSSFPPERRAILAGRLRMDELAAAARMY